MDGFIKRPAAILATVFFLCTTVTTYVDSVLISLLLLILAVASGTIFAICQKCHNTCADKRLAAAMLCLGIAFAGIFSAFVYYIDLPTENEGCNAKCTIEEKLWGSGSFSAYRAKATLESEGDFTVLLEGADPTLLPGDVVLVKGSLASVEDSDAKELQRYLRSMGIASVLESESLRLVGHESDLGTMVSELRSRVSGMILASLPHEEGGLITALVTGDRSSLSDSVRLDFTRLGVAHLLAISGIHMSVIFSALSMLLSSSPLGKRIGGIVIIPGILFYMAFCAFSPSVVRSGVMLIICMLSRFVGRRRDPYTVLCVAVMLISLLDRHVFYDTGFLLSVTSVMGVLWFGSISARFNASSVMKRVLLFIPMTALGSVAVSLFTAPIVAAEFGMMSVVSPLANVVFIPMVTVLLYAVPFFVISLPFPPLCALTGQVVGALARYTVSFAHAMADREGLTISTNYPLFFILWGGATLGCVILLTAKKKRIGAALLSLCCLGAVLSVTVFELGRKDTVTLSLSSGNSGEVLLITSGSESMLVDMTLGYSSSIRGGLELMEDRLVTEVDIYVLTHYHTRHVSALRDVLGKVYVNKVCLPDPIGIEERSVCIQIAELCEERGVKAEIIGEEVVLGDARYVPGRRCWLSRSSEAVYSSVIKAYGRQAALISPGYYEVSEDFRSLSSFDEAELFIFPTHGARVRETYPVPENAEAILIPEGSTLFFSEEELSDFAALGKRIFKSNEAVAWKRD